MGRAAYAACRCLGADTAPVRSSDRGERDRAAGMALTIEFVALRKRSRELGESRSNRAGPGPRTLGFGDGDSEVDDVLAAVDGASDADDYRVDGDRPLAFAFVLGGGLRSWRAIGPTRPRL